MADLAPYNGNAGQITLTFTEFQTGMCVYVCMYVCTCNNGNAGQSTLILTEFEADTFYICMYVCMYMQEWQHRADHYGLD
jgi:hypothetical protein